jgi:hypothetical protein
MMLSVLLFLNVIPLRLALTNLQAACVGSNRTYIGTSCYVLHVTPLKRYSQAKIACEDHLGYYGHLYNIRTETIKNVTHQLIVVRIFTHSVPAGQRK